MTVTIKCELTKDCDSFNSAQIYELSDFLDEFFKGTCEYFEVERKK